MPLGSLQPHQASWKNKRSSLVGMVAQSGALAAFGTAASRINGQAVAIKIPEPPSRRPSPTTAAPTAATTPEAPQLPQIPEQSLLDTDNPSVVAELSVRTLTPLLLGPSAPVIPPPVQFQTVEDSPVLARPRPRSLLVAAQSLCTATYDILVGLDGADLRYMDESSVTVPSPAFESPPSSSLSYPCAASSSTAPPSPVHGVPPPNTSLLQAALVRAAAQQVAASAQQQQQPPPVKVDTEVSLPRDDVSRAPVTSVVQDDIVAEQRQQQLSPVTTTSNSVTAVVTASIPALTSVTGASSDALPSRKDSADNSGSGGGGSRRDFVRSIGKRFKVRLQDFTRYPITILLNRR